MNFEHWKMIQLENGTYTYEEVSNPSYEELFDYERETHLKLFMDRCSCVVKKESECADCSSYMEFIEQILIEHNIDETYKIYFENDEIINIEEKYLESL